MQIQTVPIETLLLPGEFDAYVRPGGQPVIARGWMHGWPAMDKWDFSFFRDVYGDDPVKLAADSMSNEAAFVTTMAAYIGYILSDATGSELSAKHAEIGAIRPFYCTSYKPFAHHPELGDDFALPPFALDWWPWINPAFQDAHFPNTQGWLLISPKGAASRMHIDSHHTITWLAQVRGRKTAYLFSPQDSEAVYKGAVDPAAPDYARFPKFRDATCHKCTLDPGDMLFLPPDWWHHVVTEENSITVSQNLVNHTNFGLYIRRAYGAQLPAFLASLPPDGAMRSGAEEVLREEMSDV
ncbi:cupin-like domain-containing protein [Hoeflea ulvae]|uniref:Cupin-like domain-containing protein n=1 Tax=Hoeflea ulvae TaxID=2983764 RepID=A0ABT3YKI0_9HYPH|nr:cupin-like domain-containing protein [Hoeflea ulvae]MCY0096409.1 cupin-like domain-containing protein [Hoeflea ulvae]